MNAERQVPHDTRVGIIEEFIRKLRESGYSPKSIKGILVSSITFYYRNIKIDLEGGATFKCEQGSQYFG